jgi:transcriptional regulator with XRE-family HTH domain
MNMKINAPLVVTLRNRRSWSQEELATAAGLNLRTIQRIESDGVASLQSRKALASAFDVEVTELDIQEEKLMRTFEYKILLFKASMLTGKPPDTVAASLTKEGEQGWRLREMMNAPLSGMGNQVWALLERETTK